MSDTAIQLRDNTIVENNPALYFIQECPYIELTDNPDDMIVQGLVYNLYKASNSSDMKKLVSKQVFKKYLHDYIANGDNKVRNNTERKLGVSFGRAYCGMKLVKPEYHDADNSAYEEVLLKHYANSDSVNILDILPIGGN